MKKSVHPFHTIKEVFELLPDGVMVVDGAGLIMMYNQEICRIFGYGPDELLSKPLSILIPERFRAGHAGNVVDFFSRKTARKMVDGSRLSALSKNGQEVMVDIALSPYELSNTVYAIAVIREMSDKIHYLERIGSLERMKEELERFACVVSHDLKAPVKRIHVLVDLILQELPAEPSENLQLLVTYLRQSIGLTETLIEGILAQARMEYEKHVEALDLNHIFDEAMKGVDVPRNFSIERETTLPEIKGNPTHWLQIFLNLITNAIKYNGKAEGILKVSSIKSGGYHVLKFADNGTVVPIEKRKAIFDLFVRGSALTRDSSHGIGLSIVKKIIETGGGRIEYAESDLGGSQFLIFWPA